MTGGEERDGRGLWHSRVHRGETVCGRAKRAQDHIRTVDSETLVRDETAGNEEGIRTGVVGDRARDRSSDLTLRAR